MKMEDFIKKFAEIFEEVDMNTLDPDTKFRDLDEWDSIAVISLIAMLSDEYGKEVTTTDIRNCVTIKDIFNLINK